MNRSISRSTPLPPLLQAHRRETAGEVPLHPARVSLVGGRVVGGDGKTGRSDQHKGG